MSLSINTDHVTAVYALGEWHPVQRGTFYTDAYELQEGDAQPGDMTTFIQMGMTYPEVERTDSPAGIPGSIGERWSFRSPSGMTGASWKDPKTGEQVSMSILEIKAFRTSN